MTNQDRATHNLLRRLHQALAEYERDLTPQAHCPVARKQVHDQGVGE